MLRPSLLALLLLGCAAAAPAKLLAPPPPMGWNSWDSYGLTIGEADYRANAKVLSSLKQYGWRHAVGDMGWYMADPNGKDRPARNFQIDPNGLLIPDTGRFPSSIRGAG